MRVLMVSVVLCCSASSWAAGKKTVIVGAGDCSDAALLSANKDFQAAARGQGTIELLEPDPALRLLRPPGGRDLKEVASQIEAARQQFYEGKNERALDLVEDALTDLERTAPQAKLWPLTEAALVVQAQILKGLDRPKDSAEAFRRVLRVNPGFKLDPDSYPPSTIQALEVVRKETLRAKKGLLQVVSTPAQASVFVDGREVGKTPFKLELLQGSYRVSVRVGESVSFPHKVNLGKEAALQVNLAFEGAVWAQAPLCVSGGTDDALAIHLASAVGAEQVVVLHNTAARGAPAYITGAVYEVARASVGRNGGVRAEQLKDLVLYLFTGKPDISTQPAPPPPPLPAPELARRPPEPAPAKRSRYDENQDKVIHVAPPGPVSTARVLSYVSLGVGVAAGAVGVVVFTGGAGDRTALAALKTSAGKLPDPTTAPVQNAQARSLLGSVTANQALSFSLIGVGAGAVIGGALGLVFFPSQPTTVSLVPTREGAALSFSGSF